MELKDVILSTLAEMEDVPSKAKEDRFEVKETIAIPSSVVATQESHNDEEILDQGVAESELMYLNSIKERLLVLFEGFQAPNNTNIEAKVDMTLNFLEYTLATIDTRVEILQKRKK